MKSDYQKSIDETLEVLKTVSEAPDWINHSEHEVLSITHGENDLLCVETLLKSATEKGKKIVNIIKIGTGHAADYYAAIK